MKTETIVLLGVAAVAAYFLLGRKPAAYAAPAPVQPRPPRGDSTADTIDAIARLGERIVGGLSGGDSSGADNLVSSDSPGFFDGWFGGGDNLVSE